MTTRPVRLSNMFGNQRLREGKYESRKIDVLWTDQMEADLSVRLESRKDEVPVPKKATPNC